MSHQVGREFRVMVEVVLEGLAPNIDEATIQNWFFEEGDPVSEGDDLIEVSTSEGVVVIQAPGSGILSEVYYDEGESVPKGEVLCAIDDDEGASSKEDEEEEEEGVKVASEEDEDEDVEDDGEEDDDEEEEEEDEDEPKYDEEE